jgi:hypothetical protein
MLESNWPALLLALSSTADEANVDETVKQVTTKSHKNVCPKNLR